MTLLKYAAGALSIMTVGPVAYLLGTSAAIVYGLFAVGIIMFMFKEEMRRN